ncbi:MAG: hypothetical protein LBV72_05185 [Tannerella sp.]|jgi:hypothetical protein|nr:hypothetical protein [Tannerella sp.]
MQQTPLAQLQNKKEWIRLESREKEAKLNEHLSYMKENSDSLVLSGLSSLFFPRINNSRKENGDKHSITTKPKELFSPLSLLSTISGGKGILPIALEIAQPFLITWGLSAAKKLLKRAFTKKKK